MSWDSDFLDGLGTHNRGPEHVLRKGKAYGYCPLDENTKVPSEFLPDGGTTEENYRIVSATPVTVASDDVYMEVMVTCTIPMPAPTLKRRLKLKAVGRTTVITLTRASNGIEDTDGEDRSSTLVIAGAAQEFVGNGSVWRRW